MYGWSTRYRTRDTTGRAAVAENTSGGEDSRGEPRRDHHVIVMCRLVSSHKDRVRLTNVNIERGESSLKSVSPFDFDYFHLVVLNAEVEGVL